MNRKTLYTLVFLLALAFTSCSQSTKESVTKSFQTILDDAVKKKKINLSGVSMTVVSPDLDIHWTGVSGFDSNEKDNVLLPEQPFRIASLTKTFIAASILRLQENGKLSIEDPISNYISEEHREILEEDGYDPFSITIKHCLRHQSGLFDYAEGSSDYIEACAKDPNKRWTRTEQLQFAMRVGDPLGKPGEIYEYSDTGYILLGEIIENVSDLPLEEAMRILLKYKSLQLNSTWLESLEKRPEGLPDPVHRYLEDTDATLFDNSIDLYGGGGISSTAKDLGTFFNALFNGGVFEKENTIKLMTTKADLSEEESDEASYGLGMGITPFKDTVLYTHSGFWGTVWIHAPKYNTTIVINYTNDTEGAGIFGKTIAKIIELTEK
ncbi:serine hydrolase [Flavobacteriaceae bacterium R38]|nr:serine hydrolase [Flavobacteriaceae bacterium R38]